MKKAYRSLSVIAAVLGLGLAAQSSMASPTDAVITEAQLSKIHVGDSVDQVKQAWGAPEEEHASGSKPYLAYELSTPFDEEQHVYVSFDRDSKVTSIQVDPRD